MNKPIYADEETHEKFKVLAAKRGWSMKKLLKYAIVVLENELEDKNEDNRN